MGLILWVCDTFTNIRKDFFSFQNKLLDLERKDQENKLAQKYINKLCEEDIEKDRKKREQQRQLREDLNDANNQMLERRELEKQQDHLTDMKVRPQNIPPYKL